MTIINQTKALVAMSLNTAVKAVSIADNLLNSIHTVSAVIDSTTTIYAEVIILQVNINAEATKLQLGNI